MSSLNPNIKLAGRRTIDVVDLFDKIKSGNRYALSRAVTLIESERKAHKKEALELIELCLKEKKDTFRIGISGSPGVGKSTIIESLGMNIIRQGKKPAVLAIDPSSKLTHGSILGDKTRMAKLATNDNAFVRPSPSKTHLGGVTQMTRETILLAEAANYNPVFIETVGVGQSEIAVNSMTDLFVLLVQPGSGDELQAIKKGIVELADIIVVNKYDGKNAELASMAYDYFKSSYEYTGIKKNGWKTRVLKVSALKNQGLRELWETIEEYFLFVKSNGYFAKNRKSQNMHWFDDYLQNRLSTLHKFNPKLNKKYNEVLNLIESGEVSPYQGGDMLLDLILENLR